MVERDPGWVDGVDSAEARLITGALVQAGGIGDTLDPLRVRPGVRDSPGDPGKVALVSNKLRVNPFQAVLSDSAKPGDGPYIVTLDAVKELPFTAAHASLSRWDLVVAELVGSGFVVNVYTGVSSASPVRPEPNPGPSLVLAEIQVPKEGTPPTVTDRRQFTAGMSGILPVCGDTDLPLAANAHSSQFVYRVDTGVLLCKRNSTWVPYRPPRGDTWHLMTPLEGGWKNFVSGYNTPAYTLMDDGWVRLRGVVCNGLIGETIFTLPNGCKPPVQWLLGVSTSPDAHGLVNVLPTGAIKATKGNPAWISLDGLTFATY
jgi:hypothetical protein